MVVDALVGPDWLLHPMGNAGKIQRLLGWVFRSIGAGQLPPPAG